MKCTTSEHYYWNPANLFHFEIETAHAQYVPMGTYGDKVDTLYALEIVLKIEALCKEAISA